MKFLHTADWHLGKNLHGMSLIKEQEHILSQIIAIAKAENVNAVVISGDLYDKPIPSIEATKLLEDALYKLNVRHGFPVLAISGNHDSASRLSFGNAWYEKNELYVAGGLQKETENIIIGNTQFWLVPYHDVQTARYVFEEPGLRNVDDAMGHIVNKIRRTADGTKKQVLVGHAFVAGGLMSDSERSLSVGNVERVSIPTLEFFDYVALGHLHNPNAIKHESIHYSGSPLKYSFSEANQEKIVKIIDIYNETQVKEIALTPLKDVRVVEGTLEELLDTPNEPVDDYLKIILKDEGALIDPMGKLRQIYPNILHLERITHELKEASRESFESLSKKDDAEIFSQFFEFTSGKTMTTSQEAIINKAIVDLKRGENK